MAYLTQVREGILRYRRANPIVAGLTFLVLTAVNIPVTMATGRIWGLLIAGWNNFRWSVLREFFVDAMVATFVALSIWAVVGAIVWAWLVDRREGNGSASSPVRTK